MQIDITTLSSTPEEFDADPEVSIVAPPPPPSLAETNIHASFNNENDKEEIQVVSSTTVNPNIQYPHKRTDCGLFDFQVNPSKFCDKCYCLICDIPAKDCTNWEEHCATNSKPAAKINPPVSNDSNNVCGDDDGYATAGEILLESPTVTAQNYHRLERHNPRMESDESEDEEQEQHRTRWERQREEDHSRRMERGKDLRKMRITEVLDYKLYHAVRRSELKAMPQVNLQLSEGGRMFSSFPEHSHQKRAAASASAAAAIARKMESTTKKNVMEGDIPQLGLHSSFFVEGIKIGWPFPEIMLPQRQMAIHIIKALKRKLHVVLESPTGTGKSVTQMVASLKKTPYRPKMTILGSRERLCIHKEFTGKNRTTRKLPINIACQDRKQNTDYERRHQQKHSQYNDNDPKPSTIYGDGDPSDWSNDDPGPKPKATCPHYRQLTSDRTTEKLIRQFVGGHRIQQHAAGCCGGGGTVGGEESAFGVHDMEDLVRFGKNPHREENIAVYRGESGKFGFLINNNTNSETGEETRGCHVVSLVEGGAAEFEARLQNMDRILRVNGKDVRTWNKARVVELLRQTPNDQPARLDVLRADSDTPELLDPMQDFDPTGTNGGNRQQLDGNSETDEGIYSDHSICPYYLSRALQRHAEITFSPYNYILDPAIRRVMNISLTNTVLVLDEAHNVETTLCEGGSGKFGEIDLFQVICKLGPYTHRTSKTGNTTLINSETEVDTVILAHDLLLFVEKITFHLTGLREKFESSPGRQNLEDEYKKYHNTPDTHEIELSYDGPTGYGIKGAAVGCQPFLSQLGITKEDCAKKLELALSLEQSLFGGNSESDEAIIDGSAKADTSNVLTTLIELLSKLVTATENPEHYYIACVVQANGNLDHAFGIDDEDNENGSRRRFKKKPRTVPFMNPRAPNKPNALLRVCNVGECQSEACLGMQHGVRHGDYCNGSTPAWECHLILRLLSPGLLMREISQECRSLVLASGSLAPLPSLCAELNLFGKESSSRSSPPPSQSYLSQLSSPVSRSSITGSKLPVISQSLLDSLVKSTHGAVERLYTNRLQTTPKPLEANHVVNLPKQLLAVAIGHFPNGEKLTVSYNNYKNPNFLPKLGHTIAGIIEGVPTGGCLVFFPSYSLLEKCISCWNSTGNNRFQTTSPEVWNRLVKSKGKIIVEPTGSQEEFELARDDYQATIRETGSCILLAVFRGKMSEGISFNDAYARAVLCIGMPFPNYKDRAIQAKQRYNDEQRKLRNKTCLLPGNEYYAQQAYRAIAQALGRCIRHAADYGTVILIDSRHCDDGSPNSGICRSHKNLPKWMRGSVRTLSMHQRQGSGKQPILEGYKGLKRELRSFFARAPIASQTVRDKWKTDLENARQRSKVGGSSMVFDSETGNWTAKCSSSRTQLCNGDEDKDAKETPRKSLQI
eukprot:jgi/Psemu1/260170/estExt_Genewise1Plus.C_4270011